MSVLPADPHHVVPSLDEVFAGNSALLSALKRAKVWSVVPIMLLPKQVLIELPGIKEHRATYIRGALAEHGLGQISLHEKPRDFLAQQFGSVANTPVSALHVVTIRQLDIGCRPKYAPLHMIRVLAHLDPNTTIDDLMQMSESNILDIATGNLHFGPVIEQMRDEDIPEINARLLKIDPRFKIGKFLDAEIVKLRVNAR